MKKISIVGRGTVGCLAASHFLRWTDWEIDWIYDPNIQTSPVGEGTTLIFPKSLRDSIEFNSADMDRIHATPKVGIWKRDWAWCGSNFKHYFHAGETGIHFNAVEFQEYIFKKLKKKKRINLIPKNVTDHENLDSDYVMVCSGSPKSIQDKNFIPRKHTPVNSAIVLQCKWNHPKFLYSLTFAKEHGWLFGIPLTNRCAIGYVYNNKMSSEKDIMEDVQDVLNEFKLKPYLKRNINFFNYSRKINFTDRVCYNGNASFFLEPLEATSTSTADFVNRLLFDYLFTKNKSLQYVNEEYQRTIDETESMISLHYLNSCWDNDFWSNAEKLSMSKIKKDFKEKNEIYKIIKKSITTTNSFETYYRDVGTWNIYNYKLNIKHMKIKKLLKEMMK